MEAQVAKLYEQQRYQDAIALEQRALDMYEKVHGEEHPDVVGALGRLAGLYATLGEYGQAVPLIQRALAITEKGNSPGDTAALLSTLGGLYVAAGAYAKAEPVYQRSLAISEKVFGPKHPNTAIALESLAGLYDTLHEYAKAEPLYQQALAISAGRQNADTARLLNDLGMDDYDTAAYAKAEPLESQALAIREKLEPKDPDTAQSLNNLAATYVATGDYTKAEPLYQRALAIRTQAGDEPGMAESLNNLAALYETTGAYAKAEPLYQRSLAISQKLQDREHTAITLDNLANVYRSQGDAARAEKYGLQALAISEKLPGNDVETATTLNNLAALYAVTGRPAQAVSFYQRALAIREQLLGPLHPDTAGALNNLATEYYWTGQYAKAAPLLQRSLAINERVLGPTHPTTANSLEILASLDDATGDLKQAQSFHERALAIEETNTQRFLLSGSEARQRAYLLERMDTTFTDVSFSLARTTEASAALGLTSVLEYKGRVLDAISGSVARLRRSVAPQDQVIFDRLSRVAQELSALTFSPPPDLSAQLLRAHLDALVQEQEQLQGQLSSRSAQFSRSVARVTLDAVRQALPADAVLLEFIRYDSFDPKTALYGQARYGVYLLRRSGPVVAVDLGPARAIEDLVAEYRDALRDPGNTYYSDVAADLSAKLITPLLPHLEQAKRLLLSPDAALNLVPFAALVDDHGDFLLTRFELTYLTSGRDLLRIAAEPPPRSSPVVLAAPSYGPSAAAKPPSQPDATHAKEPDRSGLVFPPLPGTLAEATALKSILRLDQQHVLTADRATEAALRALHGPRILHLATHAFFLTDPELTALAPGRLGQDMRLPVAENPLLRAGLALAGANLRHSGDSDDGILTAAEAAQLDLVGTQLAVLSACETGLGTIQTGEGVYGLRRALVLAGAQAQLVSLWKVADDPTHELMVDYYQRLLAGEGRSQALRAAQLKMMANPDQAHPYFWAAFIPIGDWRPLTRARGHAAP